MIVLGIVGTPAGGKSTVAERLAELGADVDQCGPDRQRSLGATGRAGMI